MAQTKTQKTVKTLIEELGKYNGEVMIIIDITRANEGFLNWFIGKLATYAKTIEIRGKEKHAVVAMIIDSLNEAPHNEKEAIENIEKKALEIVTKMDKATLIYVGRADVLHEELSTPAFMTRYSTVTLKYDIQPLPV